MFSTDFEYGVEHNVKDLKLKVGDRIKILKYQKILAKEYTVNWSEEVFKIKKVKIYCTLDICYQ